MLRRIGLKTPELKITPPQPPQPPTTITSTTSNEISVIEDEYLQCELLFNQLQNQNQNQIASNTTTVPTTNNNQDTILENNVEENQRGHGTILFVVPFISLAEVK